MKYLWNLFFFVYINNLVAQHEPKAWVIGGNISTFTTDAVRLGGNIQINYAYNCYTTWVNEIHAFQFENQTGVSIGSSVNLILNNFKKQHFILTGGLGLAVNAIDLDNQKVEKSFFAISNSTNESHLSALIKLRGLLQFKPYWNWVTEANLNSLGKDFIYFSTGINYEFPYR